MTVSTAMPETAAGAVRSAAPDAPRRAMIDSQLRTSGVNDPRILSAMASVAREDFVPAEFRASAYIDRSIPLGDGRYLAAPLVHGRMLVEATPDAGDTALLVGEAQGYLCTVLGQLVGKLDCIAPADLAAKRRKGAYSLVVIDGAIEEVPAGLASLLAEDGRVVTGLVTRGVTRLAIGRRAGNDVALQPLAEIGIPVLAELAAPKRWSF